jgi:hypothetical protein
MVAMAPTGWEYNPPKHVLLEEDTYMRLDVRGMKVKLWTIKAKPIVVPVHNYGD